MPTLFDAAGGLPGLQRLAAAWHERAVADPVVEHAFSHGFCDDHVERLAAYWAEALGGPASYSARYGDESAVVRMHSGNGPHDEMNECAIACFDGALADTGLVADPRLAAALHTYFAAATWGPMHRYHGSADEVPDGLTMLRWTWDGAVCPVCGTAPARGIVWGLPAAAVFEDPELVLGGCDVTPGAPGFECRDPACRARF